MKTSVIEVHDMLSVLSVAGVERRIGDVPGVESVTVNFDAGSATVRYDETRLNIADIRSDVRQAAYESDALDDTSESDDHEGQTAQSAPPATPTPVAPKSTPDAAQVGEQQNKAGLNPAPSTPAAAVPKSATATGAIKPIGTEQKQSAKTASTQKSKSESKSGWRHWLESHKIEVLFLGLLLLALIAGGWMLLRPREVMVATVVDQKIVAEVEGTGTVTTKVLANVGSKINGRIEKMLVQENDFVEKDQIVAVLEDTDLRRQVDIARADLEVARASDWEAKRVWERDVKLLPSHSISKENAEDADAHQRVTKMTVLAKEAQLAYQEFKLTETKIPTVVSGLVAKRWVEAGATVVAGQPVVAVAETNLILVNANVDQRFTGKVQKDQAVTVILRGRTTEPFRGYVYRVYPQADAVTEEMLVQVAFPLPPLELQTGQWAEVYIEVDEGNNSLVVPKEAVITVGNDQFVFAVGEDGRARRVKVQLGATSPRLAVVAVTGELRAGEQVILMPTGIKGGQRVRVKKSPGTMSPGQELMSPSMKM
jgi:RND family efflux transporter MFP subunit